MSEIDKPACLTCKFVCAKFTGSVTFEPGKFRAYHDYQCRKHTPSFEGWPAVQPDEWCGEWEKREES